MDAAAAGFSGVEVGLQDDGARVWVLDHDALRAAEVGALGGGLGGDGAGGEFGEGLEVALRRRRRDERGEGEVGEVEGEGGMLRGEVRHGERETCVQSWCGYFVASFVSLSLSFMRADIRFIDANVLFL